MLDFFPTPFPDEWWYSILCRYYLCTGIKASQPIKEILFSNKAAQMASIFPNGTVAKVVRQLPADVFRFNDILEHHTLFRYYMRFYPKEEQEYFIRALSEGGNPVLTHVRSDYGQKKFAPRYCPMCMKEDSELYGLSFYHVSHQIPLVSVCCKHGCKLYQIGMDAGNGKTASCFRPLSLETVQSDAVAGTEAELAIAQIARDYLTKPLGYGPTEGYNNLVQVLINKGYYRFTSKLGRTIDMNKIGDALVNFYGEERVESVFHGRLDNGHMRRLRHFEQIMPDKYILLQGLVGMSFDDFLVRGPVTDPMLEKLMAIRNERPFITINQLANKMKLKNNEVRQLCKYYGIEPFWVEKYKCERNSAVVKKRITITVTEDVYEELGRRARNAGMRSPGEYLVQVALHDII